MAKFQSIKADATMIAMAVLKTPMQLSNSGNSFSIGFSSEKIMTEVELPDGTKRELPVTVSVNAYVGKDIAIAAGVDFEAEKAKLDARLALKVKAK